MLISGCILMGLIAIMCVILEYEVIAFHKNQKYRINDFFFLNCGYKYQRCLSSFHPPFWLCSFMTMMCQRQNRTMEELTLP